MDAWTLGPERAVMRRMAMREVLMVLMLEPCSLCFAVAMMDGRLRIPPSALFVENPKE